MIKDYSDIPKDMNIKNDSNEDIKIRLHNVDVCVPAGDSVNVMVTPSGELAAATRRVED